MIDKDDRSAIAGEIARRALAIRISKQIDRKVIADALGSTSTRVSRIENGTARLSAAELVVLARALNVPTSVLVGDIPATDRWEIADAY
ncbi:helix-turn-helix domain-containing protein [Amorphus sp. 3PC139-8]|uniref:helix-turn-helix domain-containing protein n=1 Tax=Amorphus sp. 3PC139-8 TaxID=2735676 RepID=UPI00345C78A0